MNRLPVLTLATCALLLAPAASASASLGDLDGTFGISGVSLAHSADGEDGAKALAIDPSGRIILAGSGSTSDPSRPGATALTLLRDLPNGQLDTSFGAGGFAQVETGTQSATFESVSLDPSGRIVAAGTATGFDGIGSTIVVARFLPDGSPDPTFGEAGRTSLGDGLLNVARDALIDDEGRIVIAGMSDGPGGLRPVAFRLTADGSPDMTFAEDGSQRFASGALSVVSAIAQEGSGGLLLAGNSGRGRMVVSAIEDDGRPRTAFGERGSAVLHTPGTSTVSDLAVDRRARVVLVGSCDCGGRGERFAAGRLRSSGALDKRFAGDGLRTIRLGGPATIDTANAVGLDRRGRIAIGGVVDVVGPKVRSALVRLTDGGKLDRPFSGDGIAASGSFSAAIEGVAIDSSDRIVVAGKLITTLGDSDFATARYLP